MNYSKFTGKFNPNDVFRIEITSQEMHYLTSIMPSGYSFHVEPRKKDMRISVPAPQKKKQVSYKESQYQNIEQSSSHMNLSKRQKSSLPSKAMPKKNQQSSYLSQKASIVQPLVSKSPGNKWVDLLPQHIKRCGKLLLQLKSHKSSLPFLEPVDAIAMGIPQYFEIIKQPMDLSQIENKLKNNAYTQFQQFHKDVLKIIENSYRFNEANQQFLRVTSDFENYYNKILSDPQAADNKSNKNQKKKKKASSSARDNIQSAPLTTLQKKQLAQQIRRLGKQHLGGIRRIVFEKQQQEDNVFDLEKLSQKKMRELQKYVRNKVIQMEDRNRNSSLQKNQNTNLDLYDSDISSFESDQSGQIEERQQIK